MSSQEINIDNNEIFIELMASETDESNVNPLEDKNFIINCVKESDNKLSFVSQNGKSVVWNRFQRIYYQNIETVFVKCIYCHDIKKQTRNIGTGGLLRHKCQELVNYLQTEEGIDSQINYGLNGSEDKSLNNSIDNENNKSLSQEMVNENNEVFESFNDRNYLISLVESNDDRLRFERQSGKSEVWNRFERIFFDNRETLYVKCKYCDDIQKQTRNIGTGSLLRHRCKALAGNCLDVQVIESSGKEFKGFRNTGNFRNKFKKKCSTVEEKIRIENKTLKQIIKKCLAMIENCLCINRNIVLEKKQINVLINDYNEWLYENQDLNPSDDEDFDSNRDDNYGSEEESCLRGSDFEDSKDLNYIPLNEIKRKTVLNPINRRVIVVNQKINTMIGSKRTYRKRVPKVIDPNLTFACDWSECGKVFKTKHILKQHRNIHLGIKRYRCLWPGCDAAFLKKAQYDIHTCSHTNEKKFKCDWPQCQYKTCRQTMLRRHRRVHTGEKPHNCDWPGCEFRTNFCQGLKTHKLTHSGIKPWKCSWPSCEWSFRQSTHLKAHMLKHTGEKPFFCEFVGCDRRFSSRQAMKFHMEKTHKN